MKNMTMADFKSSFRLALYGIANDLRTALVEAAPVDTGRLKNSIKTDVSGNTVNISMVDYALYVEFGTAPHIIKPKDAKALHWKSSGKDVFAKVVHHPGTEPQPFIRNTITGKLRDIIYKNLARQLS